MSTNVSLEVCAESMDSAIEAQLGGASRIELCRDLSVEGLTPSSDTIQEARKQIHIPLHVLIRPRVGDFVYSDDEIALMEGQILDAKKNGADGVVIGALNKDGTIDRKRTAELVQLARPMSVTFHRAFDVCANRSDGLTFFIEVGIDRLLTSGGALTAEDGVDMLKELVVRAGGRIAIIAAAGITIHNARMILSGTGVNELHVGRGVSRKVVSRAGSTESSPGWKVDSTLVREFIQRIPGTPER